MNQSITVKSLTSFVAAVLLVLPTSVSTARPKGNLANPDFSKGDAIPAGAKHDWNLGPTGLRGWMVCDKMVTTDARQGGKGLSSELMVMKAKCVRETIRAIEASTDSPQLIRLK
jgi:hypothetical protein